MDVLDIKLDWYRDSKGYRLVDRGKYGIRIVGEGGRLIPSRPVAGNNMVFMAFSKLISPGQVKDFVEKYGLLVEPAYDVAIPLESGTRKIFAGQKFKEAPNGGLIPVAPQIVLDGEDVAEHLETAKLFHRILVQSNKGWHRVPRSLAISMTQMLQNESFGEIGLEADGDRGLRLTLTANSLLNAMWLQLAAKISGGMKFRTCQLATCGRLFEVGSRPRRRADAIYCSDSHRIESNSRKRTNVEA
jgi:hypothetical protein